MPQIRVDITPDGFVIQTIIDPGTGMQTDVPLLPSEAVEVGSALIAAARMAAKRTRPTLIREAAR